MKLEDFMNIGPTPVYNAANLSSLWSIGLWYYASKHRFYKGIEMRNLNNERTNHFIYDGFERVWKLFEKTDSEIKQLEQFFQTLSQENERLKKPTANFKKATANFGNYRKKLSVNFENHLQKLSANFGNYRKKISADLKKLIVNFEKRLKKLIKSAKQLDNWVVVGENLSKVW